MAECERDGDSDDSTTYFDRMDCDPLPAFADQADCDEGDLGGSLSGEDNVIVEDEILDDSGWEDVEYCVQDVADSEQEEESDVLFAADKDDGVEMIEVHDLLQQGKFSNHPVEYAHDDSLQQQHLVPESGQHLDCSVRFVADEDDGMERREVFDSLQQKQFFSRALECLHLAFPLLRRISKITASNSQMAVGCPALGLEALPQTGCEVLAARGDSV